MKAADVALESLGPKEFKSSRRGFGRSGPKVKAADVVLADLGTNECSRLGQGRHSSATSDMRGHNLAGWAYARL